MNTRRFPLAFRDDRTLKTTTTALVMLAAGLFVPDATALELIEFPGKVGKEGKRPRFRFTTRQLRITSYLPEIDAALPAAGKDQDLAAPEVRNDRE